MNADDVRGATSCAPRARRTASRQFPSVSRCQARVSSTHEDLGVVGVLGELHGGARARAGDEVFTPVDVAGRGEE
ncbi:hypothetical protein [Actinomadura madurae]|uniref:hypothetical protein n=1 Tax=Actinomadura madurae TaxID=1993 RepID=UPI0015A56BD6|nr:hypothetical protein [Actinomadura madurae]MCP9951248.1 hypothetical protein [Actinomadura madurae]MCP9968017.1 hypothetical protein [Actinomadura madurae]MCP9980475.1 hypothetical protein [Actinomadura madurae]MCQ0008008.1 hypothetical protein [Actinomadura madurae]MCQ0016676.1 hypothetical protein [Actinomadura madurae]